ncbi:threonine--tRNA ligase [Nanoarchaeota archaeon]
MKILLLHVDYIKYKPLKKALKSVEALSEADKKGKSVKEALVVLTAVEKTDSDVKKVVSELVKNVKEVAGQVKAKNIVLYPYAHLSSNLGSPDLAVEVLKKAEAELKKIKTLKVNRSPFGYYKEFEMKVKGHPLSELSREIVVEAGKGVEEKIDHRALMKKMTKIKMSAPKGKKGLKSNIELGRDLDIFIVSEIVGGGLPLLTPKGATIKREIERFVINEELKRGYLHTATPFMAKSDLYKVSGHWQHYKDSMFIFDIGKEKFALRPMTCPFQFILYKRKSRSYKDLPKKYAEVATMFRNEQSGELRGLTRVRQMTLTDAHLICRPDQLEKEFEGVLDLLKFIMKKLGVKDTWFRFSKGNIKNKKKYIDNPKAWKESEALMKRILDKSKLKYITAKDEAAFYGPKLDLQYKDVYGKEDTLLTIQIDFALPERFGLTYKDKDNKEKRPIIIHRSASSTTERMIAYLLEKTQGNLPLWLSPVQVKVLSMTEKNLKYAEKVVSELEKQGIRVELDERVESMSKKVRDAQLEKVNYMLAIGDKEQKAKTIAVRSRDGKVKFGVKLDSFISKIKKDISNRA